MSNSTSARLSDKDQYHDYFNGLPSQPWWKNLDPEFYKVKDAFELDLRSQLTLKATAAADIGLRTAAATLLSTSALPGTFSPFRKRADTIRSEVYKPMADSGDANLFFKRPDEHVDIRESKS